MDKLYLWLVRDDTYSWEDGGWGRFDSLVVVAETEGDAIRLMPAPVEGYDEIDDWRRSIARGCVSVTRLGVADDGPPRVVLASYNRA